MNEFDNNQDYCDKRLSSTPMSLLDERMASWSRCAALVAAILVVALGALALVGWALGVPFLTRIRADAPTMKVNTALSFVAAGLSLWLLRAESAVGSRRTAGVTCAAFVFGFGALTFAEYCGSLDLGIDRLLALSVEQGAGSLHPGRMSPMTAINLMLVGLALLLLDVRWQRTRDLAPWLALAAMTLSMPAVIGYGYGANDMYRFWFYESVAIPTAMAFTVICSGIMLVRPEREPMAILLADSLGGQMARQISPGLIISFVFLGLMCLTARRVGFFGMAFGVSLLVTASTVVTIGLVLWHSKTLGRSDYERRRAEQWLRAGELRFHQLADAMPQIVLTARPDGCVDYFNERWYDFTGLSDAGSGNDNWKLIVHPDDVQKCVDAWHQSIRTGDTFEIECRLRERKSRDYRWHLARATPAKDEAGRVIRWYGTGTDIDEKKRAAEAVRESEARFRGIVEAANEGILILDENARITLVNPRMAEMLGYEPDELLGRDELEFLFAEDREMKKTLFERRRCGFSEQADVRFRRKDGTPLWTIMAARPVRDAEGAFRGALDLFTDITLRKEAEAEIAALNLVLEHCVTERTAELTMANQALIDGERRFQAIFDSAFQFIGLLSPAGITLEANRTALDFMGLSRDDVIGQVFWMTPWWNHSAKAQEQIQQAIERAAAGELCRFDADHYGAEGVMITVDFSLKPMRNEAGQVVLLIAEGRAITDQKLAAESLRVSEERFRGAFAAAPIGMALVAPDGRRLRVNDSLCKIFGRTEDDLLAGSFRDSGEPDDLTADLEDLRRFLAGEKLEYRSQWRYSHADGRVAWLKINASLVRDLHGAPLHFVAQIEDITATRTLEDDLRTARDQAMAATRAKSDFLANMSHEIRTPMNGVLGMTELMMDTPLSPTQFEYMGIVKSSANALMSVINDILDFSKIEAGMLELDPMPFNLYDCLEDTLRLLAPRVHAKGIELMLRIHSAVPEMLVGDAGRLRQVLVNLIANASKFTDSGEIILAVEVDRPAEADDDVVVHFAVSDTGRGDQSRSDCQDLRPL